MIANPKLLTRTEEAILLAMDCFGLESKPEIREDEYGETKLWIIVRSDLPVDEIVSKEIEFYRKMIARNEWPKRQMIGLDITPV